MDENDLIEKINSAKCMECGIEMEEADVRAVIDENVGDIDEVTDALYDAKPCNCDATTMPVIATYAPLFGDTGQDDSIDDDYHIKGHNGQPDRWTYDVDDDLVERVENAA